MPSKEVPTLCSFFSGKVREKKEESAERAALMGMLRKRNNEQKTPLQLAVEGNHKDVAELILQLLQEIPDVQETFSRAEKLLLHLAAERGFEDVVHLLIQVCGGRDWRHQKGALVSRVNEDGRLAIHMAALNNRTNVVEMLLREDENSLEAVDYTGWTPLLAAVTRDNTETINV